MERGEQRCQKVRRVGLWWGHCKSAIGRDGECDQEHRQVFSTAYIPRRLKSREGIHVIREGACIRFLWLL